MSIALKYGNQDCSTEPVGIPLDKDYPVTMQHQQADMIKIATIANTLAFLPCTNDKMFVSFSVVKHCLVAARSSGCSHKKSIALLSPTRSQVNQQRAYIQAHDDADIVVREYTGDTSRGGRKVDEWTLQVWRQEVTEADVMIFIPQIIMMVFQRGFLSVTEFRLFVLDECHIAYGRDPMAVVCSMINSSCLRSEYLRSESPPLVLAVTASALACRKSQIPARISALEELTGCRIFTPKCSPECSSDLNILRYGSKADSCDYSTSSSTSYSFVRTASLGMVKSNAEKQRRSPLCVADSLGGYEDTKERREMSEDYLISAVSQPLSVLTHAWERVVHARELLSLQHIMTTKRLGPSQMENRCDLGGTEFWKIRSAAAISSLDASTRAFLHTVQRMRDIAVESGALCALWALAISLEPPLSSEIKSYSYGQGFSVTDNSAIDCEEQSSNLMFILSDKLKESSFNLSSLLDPEHVVSTSTIDMFAALASALGSEICGRAATALQISSLEQQSSRATVCSARELVIKVLSALHHSDSKDCSVSLIFRRGGGGVASSLKGSSPSELRDAVCEGCIALLHAVRHEELQLCLSLPLSAAAIMHTHTGTLDLWKYTEGRDAEIVVTLGKMAEMEERDSMMTALWSGCVDDDIQVGVNEEKGEGISSTEKSLPVISVKAVALYHLWCQLRCSAEAQGDRKGVEECVEEGEEVEEVCAVDDYEQIAQSHLTPGWGAVVLCSGELHAQSLRRLVCMLHSSTASARTLSSVSPDTRLAPTNGCNGDEQNIPRDDYEDGEVGSEGEEESSMEVGCGILHAATSTSRMYDGFGEAASMIPAFDVTDTDFNLDFQSDVNEGEKAVEEAGSRSTLHQLALHYDLPLSADSYSSRARHETHAIYLVPYGPTGRHAMKSLGALSRMKTRTVACPSLSLSLTPSAVSVPVPASLLVPHSAARFADVLPLSMPMQFTSHEIDMDRDCPGHATTNHLLTSSAGTAVHDILDRDEHGDVYDNGDGERDRDRNRDGNVEGKGDGVVMVIEERPLEDGASGTYVRVHTVGQGNDIVKQKGKDLGKEKGKEKDKKEENMFEIFIKTVPDFMTPPTNKNDDKNEHCAFGSRLHLNNNIVTVSAGVSPTNSTPVSISPPSSASTSAGGGNSDVSSPLMKGETTMLHLYRTEVVKSADIETERVLLRCPGCLPYLNGLNRTAFSLLSPLPEDVLNTPIGLVLREKEDIQCSIVYLGHRLVSPSDLLQMQRFHRGMLCWETEDDYGRGRHARDSYFIATAPPCIVRESGRFKCVGASEWAASGGGSWYCLFPLPDRMTALHSSPPQPPPHSPQHPFSHVTSSVGLELDSPPTDGDKGKEDCSSKGTGGIDGHLDDDTFTDSVKWSNFLKKSADEAQVLSHNLRMQEELNKRNAPDSEHPFGDPIMRCPLRAVSGMLDKVVTKGRGGLFLTAATLEGGSKLNDVMKIVKKQETPVEESSNTLAPLSDPCDCGCSPPFYPSFSSSPSFYPSISPVRVPCCRLSYSDKKDSMGLEAEKVITFRDHMCSQHNTHMTFIKALAADPKHQMLKTTAITHRLTLAPMLGPVKGNTPTPTSLSASASASKVRTSAARRDAAARVAAGLPARQCQCSHTASGEGGDALEDGQLGSQEESMSVERSARERDTQPAKPRKDHTHAAINMLIPEFIRVIGEAKWFYCGLAAPSVMWRVQSLLLAVEARKEILDLVDSFSTANPTIKNPMSCVGDEGLEPSGPDEEKIFASAVGRFTIPTPQVMLQAITPRMAGERINSERLEHLGDCLLKLVTSVELYLLYPEEKENYLTKKRGETISNHHLFRKAQSLGIDKFIRAVALSTGKQSLSFSPPGMFPSCARYSSWNKDLNPSIGDDRGAMASVDVPPLSFKCTPAVSAFKHLPALHCVPSCSPVEIEVEVEGIVDKIAHSEAKKPSKRGEWFSPKRHSNMHIYMNSPDNRTSDVEVEVEVDLSQDRGRGVAGNESVVFVSSSDRERERIDVVDMGEDAGAGASKRSSADISMQGSEGIADSSSPRISEATHPTMSLSISGPVSVPVLRSASGGNMLSCSKSDASLSLDGDKEAVGKCMDLSPPSQRTKMRKILDQRAPKNSDNEGEGEGVGEGEGGGCFVGPTTALVKGKNLSDLLEAIIGAFYAQGGVQGAVAAIQAVGAWPGAWRQTPGGALEMNGSSNAPFVRESSLSVYQDAALLSHARPSSSHDRVRSMQEKLGYRFRNPSLLSLALTHKTMDSQHNNQRLEWLGDAVLDFIVVRELHWLYEMSEDGPGKLSSRKVELTSNDIFGRIAMKMRLFEDIFCASSHLEREFSEAKHLLEGIDFYADRSGRLCGSCGFSVVKVTGAALVHSSKTTSASVSDQSAKRKRRAECPQVTAACMLSSAVKTLADLLEALIGAVYLDSGHDLDAVLQVVYHIELDIDQVAEERLRVFQP